MLNTYDSRDIAKKFGLKHVDILKKIDNLKNDLPDKFESEEKSYKYKGRIIRYVLLNRAFFLIVAMSLPGLKALSWKLTFENMIKDHPISLDSNDERVIETGMEVNEDY